MNKDIMIAAGFGDAVARVERGECATCGETVSANEFTAELSAREFGISGMCQSCQDGTFLMADDYFEPESYDLSDDGDALASAGWGTDEDYGSY